MAFYNQRLFLRPFSTKNRGLYIYRWGKSAKWSPKIEIELNISSERALSKLSENQKKRLRLDERYASYCRSRLVIQPW